jgi:hypothetical protein
MSPKSNFPSRVAVLAIASVVGVVMWNINSTENQSLETEKVKSSITKKALIRAENLEFNKELERVYENIEAQKETAGISASQVSYTAPKYIAIGMNMAQVQLIQGQPSNVHDNTNEIVWRYGVSAVVFVEGVVTEWSNKGNNLKLTQ